MKRLLKFQESDQGDGSPARWVELSDLAFTPLDYAALKGAILHQPMRIRLDGTGTIVSSSLGETGVGQRSEFKSALESPFSSKCIGLVRGGWLPSAIALQNDTIVLPDRCVVAQLSARLKNGIRKPQAPEDFIDLFADSTVRINPLIFVLEGDGRENPNLVTLERQLKEAVSMLRSALPKVTFVAADAHGLKGVLGLVEDTQRSMARKQDFLLRLNPKLKSPIARKHVRDGWIEVLVTADDCGIQRHSLVVLAALSTVAISNGRSPAKKLLKFKGEYTKGDAYNALADLRSLEVLMYTFAMFPNQSSMLCTADKSMALFWTGLHPTNFDFSNNRVTFDVSLGNLLPGITDDMMKEFLGATY
jgi:hypothetical protein